MSCFMILIYGKWKVWTALKELCEYLNIPAEMKDDKDEISDFSAYETIIPSPGIPPTHRIYTTGKILGELDFVYQFLPKNFKIISITGTDGKSTTAWIMYNILRQEFGDDKVFLSGNFEIPFAATLREILQKWLKRWHIVIEISSFMAYNIRTFTSDYSIFTNLEPDHLNWHSDMRDYFLAKWRIFENTKNTRILHTSLSSRLVEFDIRDKNNIRYYGAEKSELNEKDYVSLPDIIISGRKKYSMTDTRFSGIYNAQNILACALVWNEMWICSKRTKKYLQNIDWLSHRIEFLKNIWWVDFYDDGKSTSSQSLRAALESFKKPIILIAGWSDKWDPFEKMEPLFEKYVKHAELIGQTKELIWNICTKSGVSFHYSSDMKEAVMKAFERAKKWDTIVLSPGCASLDMFRDYLDRANQFREAVDSLK